MTKTKSTKRALIMSALALLACVSMLVGSTFAWFTDSVTSGSNVIKSGKLDVALLDANGDSLEGEMIEWVAKDGRAQDEILWEPGCTYNSEKFTIKNVGNLAFKFKVIVNGIEGDAKLLEVIDFTCIAKDQPVTINMGGFDITTTQDVDLMNGIVLGNGESYAEFMLEPGQAMENIVLSGHMDEEAGNEYQGLTIENISISVLATQVVYEEDSFDGTYDEDATYPDFIAAGKKANEAANVSLGNVDIEIPADAPAGNYVLTVDNTSVTTDENGKTVANYDIELTKDGQAVDDGQEYTVTVKVAAGITADTVKVLHKGEEIAFESVDPVAGTVTFKTNSFSPYAIIYTVECNVFEETDGAYTVYNVFNADGLMEVHDKFATAKAGLAKIKLCADIDMAGKVWTPVDSHVDLGKSYLVELDGQGYTVLNLTINGQAMFRRFAGVGDVTIKNITFDKANVNSNGGLNTSILTVQTYQNVLLDNVDVKNSSITGGYKVAPLIGTVYNESSSSITATLKNCDVSDTTVTATTYDFFTCGMVSFVYTTDNDFIEYENCSVTNVQLRAHSGGYNYHANIHYTSADTDDQINAHPGVTVTNVTFENI